VILGGPGRNRSKPRISSNVVAIYTHRITLLADIVPASPNNVDDPPPPLQAITVTPTTHAPNKFPNVKDTLFEIGILNILTIY